MCEKQQRPIPLLPLFSKIFDRLICNAIYFLDYILISSNQFCFKSGDSCINQLVAITHDIFKGFDDGLEVKEVFLRI